MPRRLIMVLLFLVMTLFKATPVFANASFSEAQANILRSENLLSQNVEDYRLGGSFFGGAYVASKLHFSGGPNTPYVRVLKGFMIVNNQVQTSACTINHNADDNHWLICALDRDSTATFTLQLKLGNLVVANSPPLTWNLLLALHYHTTCLEGQTLNLQGVCEAPAPDACSNVNGRVRNAAGGCEDAPCPEGQRRNMDRLCVAPDPVVPPNTDRCAAVTCNNNNDGTVCNPASGVCECPDGKVMSDGFCVIIPPSGSNNICDSIQCGSGQHCDALQGVCVADDAGGGLDDERGAVPDGILPDVDNCVGTNNPDQQDTDGDGTGDACDPNPYDPNPSGSGEEPGGTSGGSGGGACSLALEHVQPSWSWGIYLLSLLAFWKWRFVENKK
ncbi:MAG: hypothetical protein Q7R40_17935 [Phaeospirillum sp.]|nr:hypothetical protein [Phaeospirillum sp.]